MLNKVKRDKFSVEQLVVRRFDIAVDDIEETMLIALKHEQIIGTIHCGHKEKKSSYIRLLYIHKDWRKKGIATELIDHCIKISKESKCETLGLQVCGNNINAIELYKKMGFLFSYEYDGGNLLMTIKL